MNQNPDETTQTPDPVPEHVYQDLLASLDLYTGYHTWTQLTTEQKELFADAIDASNERMVEAHDGTWVGETPKVERWWRADYRKTT